MAKEDAYRNVPPFITGPGLHHINKLTEEVFPTDFNRLPLLLFPGDRLVAIGGLEQVTFSDEKQ